MNYVLHKKVDSFKLHTDTLKSNQDILWTETTHAYTVVYLYHSTAFPNKNKLNY